MRIQKVGEGIISSEKRLVRIPPFFTRRKIKKQLLEESYLRAFASLTSACSSFFLAPGRSLIPISQPKVKVI